MVEIKHKWLKIIFIFSVLFLSIFLIWTGTQFKSFDGSFIDESYTNRSGSIQLRFVDSSNCRLTINNEKSNVNYFIDDSFINLDDGAYRAIVLRSGGSIYIYELRSYLFKR